MTDPANGWTTETLYRHFNALMTAQERAIKLAEENATIWRASANEWRGAMTDRERAFMSRTELDMRFTSIDDQLKELKTQQQLHLGKATGLNAGWGYLIAAVATVVLLVQFFSQSGL